MKPVSRPTVPLLASLAAFLLYVACGTGGDLHVLPDAGESGLRGVVWKGPVAGATVTAYALSPQLVRGRELGTATTDETGAFFLPDVRHIGDLVLVARGGSYLDEATGESVQLDESELTAVVLDYETTRLVTGLSINPVTHLDAVLAQVYVDSRAISLAEGLQLARERLEDHFLSVGWPSVTPADLLAPRGAQVDQEARAALVLAGLSWQAKTISEGAGLSGASRVTAMSVVEAYAQDLAADGFFDGQARSGPILIPAGGTVSSSGPTAYRMSDATARAHLALAIQRFVASSRNATAIALADVDSLVNSISRNSNPGLFRTAGAELDTAPAEVTFAVTFAPQPGMTSGPVGPDALVRGLVTVTATASDLSGMQALAVAVNGAPLTPAAQGNSPTLYVGTWDTALGPDGLLTFTATTRDNAATPNDGTASVTVSVDNSAPAIVVTSPAPGGFYGATAPILADAVDPHGLIRDGFTLSGLSGFSDADASDGRVAGGWSVASTSDGPVLASFRACDVVGNCATATRPFAVDRTPPEVTVVVAPVQYTGTASTYVRVSAIDSGAGVGGVRFSLNGTISEGVQEGTDLYGATLPLLPGQNAITIWATDAAADAANSGFGAPAPHQRVVQTLYDTADPAVSNVAGGGSYRSERDIGIAETAPGTPAMPVMYTGLSDPEPLSLGSTVYKSATRLGWEGVTPSAAELEGSNASNTPYLKFRAPFQSFTDAPFISARYTITCPVGCGAATAPVSGDLLEATATLSERHWVMPVNGSTFPPLGRVVTSPVTLQLRVEVTDAAGRVGETTGTLTWHLVSPPLSWTEETNYAEAQDPQAVHSYRLASSNYDNLFSPTNPTFSGGAPMRVARYVVRNPFTVPVVVQLTPLDSGRWSLLEDWDDDVYDPPDTSTTYTQDGFTFSNTPEWAVEPFHGYCGTSVPPFPCGVGLPGANQVVSHEQGTSVEYSCHAPTTAPPRATQPVDYGSTGWSTRGYVNPLPDGNELAAAIEYPLDGRSAWRVPAAVDNVTPGVIVLYVVVPRVRTGAPPLAAQTLPGRSSPAYRYHYRDYWLPKGPGTTSCQDETSGEEYRSTLYARRYWYRQLTSARFTLQTSLRLTTLGTYEDGLGAFPVFGTPRVLATGVPLSRDLDLTQPL